MNLEEEQQEITNSVYTVGYMCGASMKLNVELLEKYLDANPKEFFYGKQCRAAIKFRKEIFENINKE